MKRASVITRQNNFLGIELAITNEVDFEIKSYRLDFFDKHDIKGKNNTKNNLISERCQRSTVNQDMPTQFLCT